jgi:phage-related protein
MTTAGQLGIDIVPEVKGIGRALSASLHRAADDADRRTRGTGSRLVSSLLGGLESLAKVGGAVAGTLIAAAVTIGKESLDAFTQSNIVSGQTTAVLKSTAGAAGVTAKDVGSLASSIRDYSGIEDEAIQSGENLLLTFTNIRNQVGAGNDIFTQATATMADLSAALGQDTKASAIQLGKALNDPVRGVTALRRVGVSFTKEQQDQIKTLVDAGKTLEAQKVILGELTKEFGGSAKAMGKADPAAILKSQAGDVKEQIGGAIMPVVAEAGRALLPVLKQIAPVVAAILAGLVPLSVAIWKAVAPVVDALLVGLKPLLVSLGPSIAANTQVLLVLLTALGEILVALAPLLPVLARLVAAVAPLIGVVVWLDALFYAVLAPVLIGIVDVLTTVIEGVSTFFGEWKTNWERFVGAFEDIWSAVASVLGGVFDGLIGLLKDAINVMIGSLNRVIHGINEAAEKGSIVGLIPGVSIKDIPDIPTLAVGTADFEGGLALVHEGEQIVLPERRTGRTSTIDHPVDTADIVRELKWIGIVNGS